MNDTLKEYVLKGEPIFKVRGNSRYAKFYDCLKDIKVGETVFTELPSTKNSFASFTTCMRRAIKIYNPGAILIFRTTTDNRISFTRLQ